VAADVVVEHRHSGFGHAHDLTWPLPATNMLPWCVTGV
jgi:hypothetical protein